VEKISPIFINEYDQVIELWESSVKATHDFILEKDIMFYKNIIKKYLEKPKVRRKIPL
jgi:putative acetyltransferase